MARSCSQSSATVGLQTGLLGTSTEEWVLVTGGARLGAHTTTMMKTTRTMKKKRLQWGQVQKGPPSCSARASSTTQPGLRAPRPRAQGLQRLGGEARTRKGAGHHPHRRRRCRCCRPCVLELLQRQGRAQYRAGRTPGATRAGRRSSAGGVCRGDQRLWPLPRAREKKRELK